jgi:hypothetical protein
VDLDADDLLGRLLRDFFDVHAAGSGRHEGDTAGVAIEQQAEVQLALDLRAGLDVDLVDRQAFGPVCFVVSRWPSMPAAAAATSATDFTTLTPPALPRPPACTCALTTQTEPPRRSAASTASSGVAATKPVGTGMP